MAIPRACASYKMSLPSRSSRDANASVSIGIGYGKRVRNEFRTQLHPESLIWCQKCEKERKGSKRVYEIFLTNVRSANTEDLAPLIAENT